MDPKLLAGDPADGVVVVVYKTELFFGA